MRRAFIAFSMLAFLVYAWASVAFQNRVAVPDSPEADPALIDRKYRLRDTVYNRLNPQDPPLFHGGAAVDKQLLDALRAAGVDSITVSGVAPAVDFQFGTAIMTALIFFALVAALKPVVWDPFTLMLEKRAGLLEEGAGAQRRNLLEAERIEEERNRLRADLAREIQTLRLDRRRETANEANALLREAREKAKEARLAGLREIAAAAEEARAALRSGLPALAEAVAETVMPKGAKREG